MTGAGAMNRIRVLLADDHHVVRQGLRALLSTVPDFEIVGEAGDGQEALSLVDRLKPDVLLLDLMLPGLHGFEVTRRVARRTSTRVVILSMHDNEGYVIRALQHGALGYVLKGAQLSDLVQAVREAVAGRLYLGPPLSDHAVQAYLEKAKSGDFDIYDSLTPREREILQLVAEGHTNGVIGERLHISPRTVETHRAHIMQKLGLKHHADLIRFALQRGLLSLDE
jgi:two-component system, NarL family, response regulator NreC